MSSDDDLCMIKTAVVAAGVMAMGFFRRDIRTWSKENASPVTEADLVVDRFLMQALRAARPDYGWLSEETADDPNRLARRRVFIVDPIDGTRGFIRGDDSWTVCIGVVQDGVSVAGVVYAPARDELYEAARGQGARLNGKLLPTTCSGHQPPILPAPEAVHRLLEETGLAYRRGPSLPSLAYRLVQVAAGELDAAVVRRGAQDWDIAAASLILEESGVVLEDVCCGLPVFNKPDTRHGALAAFRDPSLKKPLGTALRDTYGCPDTSAHSGELPDEQNP